VQRRLDGNILRYSSRKALFVEARFRGIDRFQANLIIAAVQHSQRSGARNSSAGTGRSAEIPGQAITSRSAHRAMMFVAAGLVQGAIIAAAWWLWIQTAPRL
jgi:hypothetical protein